MTSSNSKSILIVDDEPCLSQLLSILLTSSGYTIKVVATGGQAVECLAQDVDLVIIDMIMLESEGIKICQQLKFNSQTRGIPVIMIRGNQDKPDGVPSLYSGAEDYLTRPFEPEELLARIDVIFRRQHLRSMDENFLGQQNTMCELRRIIDERAIDVCFQPIYFLKSMRLLGLEMLSRPQTSGEMASPEIFFKNALKHGVYYEVEMIGWRKAIKMAADHFDGQQKLFLNCDPYLFESDKFKTVKDIFCGLGMSCNKIFLEITERSAIISMDIFHQRLRECRHDGFKIAVDDLGTGYASLGSIVEIRPEAVKLDRHIINGVADDPYKRSVVRLFVAFCRENSILCIAEGIENKQDFEALIELGVDGGQGYYLYRPSFAINLLAMQNLKTS